MRAPSLADFIADPSLKSSDAAPVRQCAHFFKSGRQCPRIQVDGAPTCRLHGGAVALKDATASQQRRLLALQEVAIDVAEELLICATDERVKLSAALAIFDRTGMGPKSTVAVEQSADLSTLSIDELTQELSRLTQLARDESHRQKALEEIPMSLGANVQH